MSKEKPELDWDYIIKNKCLCWFWEDKDNNEYLGILKQILPNRKRKFKTIRECYFTHCRPVRKDEVTFYEDKKVWQKIKCWLGG